MHGKQTNKPAQDRVELRQLPSPTRQRLSTKQVGEGRGRCVKGLVESVTKEIHAPNRNCSHALHCQT